MYGSPKRRLDRKDYNPGARYLMFLGVVAAMFLYLVSGLINLQLKSSDDYQKSAETRRTTKITLRGSRGMITDADAVIMAKDEMVYNVTFYRDASQNSTDQYTAFTQSISDGIDIIEGNGSKLAVKFVIERNPDTGEWQFNFGSGVSEAVLQTRESQWRNNNYYTTTSVPTAAIAIEKLKKRFQIPATMSEARMLQVMAVYSEMQMNLYNSQPIVIAKDVPYETVIEIETRSMTLPGMEVAVGTKRILPAQHFGRTGDRLHRRHPITDEVGRIEAKRLQITAIILVWTALRLPWRTGSRRIAMPDRVTRLSNATAWEKSPVS